MTYYADDFTGSDGSSIDDTRRLPTPSDNSMEWSISTTTAMTILNNQAVADLVTLRQAALFVAGVGDPTSYVNIDLTMVGASRSGTGIPTKYGPQLGGRTTVRIENTATDVRIKIRATATGADLFNTLYTQAVGPTQTVRVRSNAVTGRIRVTVDGNELVDVTIHGAWHAGAHFGIGFFLDTDADTAVDSWEATITDTDQSTDAICGTVYTEQRSGDGQVDAYDSAAETSVFSFTPTLIPVITGMSLDSAGRIYCVGDPAGGGGSNKIERIAADGSSSAYWGPDLTPYLPNGAGAVRVDGSDNVWVLGLDSGDTTLHLIRIDPTGALVSAYQPNPASGVFGAADMDIDSHGIVYYTQSQDRVYRYRPSTSTDLDDIFVSPTGDDVYTYFRLALGTLNGSTGGAIILHRRGFSGGQVSGISVFDKDQTPVQFIAAAAGESFDISKSHVAFGEDQSLIWTMVEYPTGTPSFYLRKYDLNTGQQVGTDIGPLMGPGGETLSHSITSCTTAQGGGFPVPATRRRMATSWVAA